MELEVGMYVRTNEGYIAKLIGFTHCFNPDGEYDVAYKFDKDIDNYKNTDITWFYLEKIIKNASHNIIDLIEVGDIITFINDNDVYRVNCIPDKTSVCDCFYLEFAYAEKYGVEDISVFPEVMKSEISSIITKEEFERRSYKVGE